MRIRIELSEEFDRQLVAAVTAVSRREVFDDLDVWFAMPLSRLKGHSWRCRPYFPRIMRHILAYLAAQPGLVCDAQGCWHLRRASEG